jgi:serine/threonine-protein kinase
LLARIGSCRIVAELGSGTLSTVYRAVQEPLGREVAIKALKESISTTASLAAELTREALILSKLGHSNIAVLYELVKTETELYLVMEYVPGPSLSEILARRPKLAPEAAAIVGAAIARALEHAHERGIVHRDVKPGNILVSLRGEVKLIDFGIAQEVRTTGAPPPEPPSLAFGTPAYMSPEQILGDAADARSDLFSLGVVLYQMLSGSRPFEDDDAKDARAPTQRIRRAAAVPLRASAPGVPRQLERVVMKLLEKLPADRYASAGVLADELETLTSARVRGSPRGVVARALREAGFAKAQAPAGEVTQAVEPPLRPVFVGFAVILAIGAAGGLAIELGDAQGREAAHVGEAPLELAPSAAASLRIVAVPWADVSIDGQHLDTTPFARPIPLSPGPHFVLLTHPDAPPEQRVVRLGPGANEVLDVTMRLRSARGNDAATASTDARAGGGT